MNDLPPDPELNANKITYTYDAYDRIFLKNYYLGSVGRRRGGYPSFTGPRKPKKLLYQDVYRYKSNISNSVLRIDRIYTPIISSPTISRDGSNVVLTANITSKSPILGSGFMYAHSLSHNRENMLNTYTLYPPTMFYKPGINALTGNDGDSAPRYIVYTGDNGIGKISWSFTEAESIAVKAFCTMETGVLFSKAVSE